MKARLFIIFTLICSNINAQTNYNDIRTYFLQGYTGEIDTNEGSALNQFLREDAFLKWRFQNLSIEQISLLHQSNNISSFRSAASTVTANWEEIGPFKKPPATSSGLTNTGGDGLFTAIKVDPTNSNKLFAVSAHGGAWKTVDGGINWNNLTDFSLPTTQTSDIAVDPSDPNYMYIATGDRDDYHNLTLCNGIYRSTDGGVTWSSVNNGLGPLIGFASIS